MVTFKPATEPFPTHPWIMLSSQSSSLNKGFSAKIEMANRSKIQFPYLSSPCEEREPELLVEEASIELGGLEQLASPDKTDEFSVRRNVAAESS